TKVEGFIVSEHMEVWPEALKELGTLVATGKLKYRETIADGLAAADRAKTELASANQAVEAQLAQTRTESTKLLGDAEKRAAAIVEEAKKRAEDEAAKIIAQAKADAEQQVVRAREALREQVAVLAVKGAE
ncbi:F0F1 ATP synthase subunit B, partial [Escherichia coli]|uniref:F0F1 ATP synthase subunit B n=1 Tax=Escherichia coli TaxID=562 RepID=UPI0011736900